MTALAEAAGRLLLVGAGNMGGAMLDRWLAAGMPAERVTVVSPSGRAMPPGVRVVAEVPAATLDTIVLALKPQQIDALRTPAFAALSPTLIVSVLAGVRLADVAALCGAATAVRAMPNLPVAIGAGVTALHSAADAPEAARTAAATLMAPLGTVEWIADEALFDAVTALSGCGPAFLFRFVDALAAAGATMGLPADQAARLALATVAGSAAFAVAADASPAALADRVASKGGATRAGLDVLDAGGALDRLLAETLRAARDRAAALADAAPR